MAGSSTPTLDRTIYDQMIHSQVSDSDVREQWARFTSAVAASVIETFKNNPQLLAECMAGHTSYVDNLTT